jgi:uncharacterized protein (TIGR03435 family)
MTKLIRSVGITALVVLLPEVLSAQQPAQDPAFEVASIKRNLSGLAGARVSAQGRRFSLLNAPISVLIFSAYQLDDSFQLFGHTPNWVRSDPYDIVATSDRDISFNQLTARGEPSLLQMMLRHLLAERFAFSGRIEQREMPAYELIKAKRTGELGPQLRSSTTDCAAIRSGPDSALARQPLREGGPPRCGIAATATSFAAGSMSIPQLISLLLAPRAQRPVIDRTDLAGEYEISLTFALEDTSPSTAAEGQRAPLDTQAPSLFAAIEEQLGLKLVQTKRDVRVLVVDNIDMPSPD